MTPREFVAKWSQIQQKETAVSQSHFNDICQLVGHPPPLEYDPEGKVFSFETQTIKPGGAKGFADVSFKGKFIWEYKGPHKDLDKAYQQLQLYREYLENPPLLITSDIRKIIIHTNFNNYPTVSHTITFNDIEDGDGVQKLAWAFSDPTRFTPEKTQEQITKATAETFLGVANAMKQHQQLMDEDYTPEQLAHFLVRLLFCLFAEDMKLLPDAIFTQIVKMRGGNYDDLQPVLRDLFAKMRTGGNFGFTHIRYFDGTLFDDDFVPSIPYDLGRALLRAAEQDWAQVDPSIFGTLFERIIDESKRAQLGAHYTSEDDIMLIVEPVLMTPLRQKWDDLRRQVDRLLRSPAPLPPNSPSPDQLLADFAAEIASVRILDPACGSGNFLYVALRQLLDLQKQVIAFAARRDLPLIDLSVSPEQLYGIEVNPYAHELAQITAWIGYLQWRHENGFGEMSDPILRPLKNIVRMDAILAYDEDGRPVEPEWPAADVIIGNPPFLGSYKLRTELGEQYVSNLFVLYKNQIPGASDLVCYWFEKAKKQITNDKSQRAGLIATNSIRGGANREVLKRIKNSGNIFMAWSDKSWILDGAAVRVSLIGFDNGDEKEKSLDGKFVSQINSDLTSAVDLSEVVRLQENQGIVYKGMMKGGPFDIDEETAKKMLLAVNPNGKNNKNVVKKRLGGQDVVKRTSESWVIDFGVGTTENEARNYEKPYEYVSKHVKPIREKNRRESRRKNWWLFGEPNPALRKALEPYKRCIVTPETAKHRIFVWMLTSIIPDYSMHTFARDDDYFFGVIHSRLHEVWALRMGTSLEDRPRYIGTTIFESFPLPWPPGQEPSETEDARVAEIAHWGRALNDWREAWLNPPRSGMYAGLGDAYDKMVSKRTLTNLYNGLVYYRETVKSGQLFLQSEFDNVTRRSVSRTEIQELDDIHTQLDTAVLDAYGWPHHLSDEEILEHLLVLNLERAQP